MSNIFVKENVSENEYFIHEWVYYLIKNNSNSKENHINIKVPKIYNYDSYLVEYPDITGYNFMLDKGENLWIIDFEHAKCRDIQEPTDNFVLKFINGTNEWNPEFK